VIGNSHKEVVSRNTKLSLIDAFHRDNENGIKKFNSCSLLECYLQGFLKTKSLRLDEMLKGQKPIVLIQ